MLFFSVNEDYLVINAKLDLNKIILDCINRGCAFAYKQCVQMITNTLFDNPVVANENCYHRIRINVKNTDYLALCSDLDEPHSLNFSRI